jgi:hypothetical protein
MDVLHCVCSVYGPNLVSVVHLGWVYVLRVSQDQAGAEHLQPELTLPNRGHQTGAQRSTIFSKPVFKESEERHSLTSRWQSKKRSTGKIDGVDIQFGTFHLNFSWSFHPIETSCPHSRKMNMNFHVLISWTFRINLFFSIFFFPDGHKFSSIMN